MLKLIGGTAIILSASCSIAFAQTSTVPVDPAPRAAPEAVRPVEAPTAVAPGGAVVPAQPLNDPNSTGPDKVNGLEVPQMKGEPPTAR